MNQPFHPPDHTDYRLPSLLRQMTVQRTTAVQMAARTATPVPPPARFACPYRIRPGIYRRHR